VRGLKKFSPRMLRRMQARMLGSLGLDLKELGAAEEVLMVFEDKEVVIKGANVVEVKLEGERVFQIIGGEVIERAREEAVEEYEPSDEDVMLVANQAGVSEERAREVLKQVDGDLAKAILLLKSEKH